MSEDKLISHCLLLSILCPDSNLFPSAEYRRRRERKRDDLSLTFTQFVSCQYFDWKQLPWHLGKESARVSSPRFVLLLLLHSVFQFNFQGVEFSYKTRVDDFTKLVKAVVCCVCLSVLPSLCSCFRMISRLLLPLLLFSHTVECVCESIGKEAIIPAIDALSFSSRLSFPSRISCPCAASSAAAFCHSTQLLDCL